MMTKFQKIRRKVLGYLSFSTALFIFQACYGPPQDMEDDVLLTGVVKSITTDLPIPGIKVTIDEYDQSIYTDENGVFELYTLMQDQYRLKFEDVDDHENGLYGNEIATVDANEAKSFMEILLQVQ